MLKTVSDLEVYNLSYQLAMYVFEVCKLFPADEKYSLTSQIVRSSRSVAANIAEGWGRRIYEAEFKKHLIYASASLEETKTWANFASDLKYIDGKTFQKLIIMMDELGAKLYKLHANWKTK